MTAVINSRYGRVVTFSGTTPHLAFTKDIITSNTERESSISLEASISEGVYFYFSRIKRGVWCVSAVNLEDDPDPSKSLATLC